MSPHESELCHLDWWCYPPTFKDQFVVEMRVSNTWNELNFGLSLLKFVNKFNDLLTITTI